MLWKCWCDWLTFSRQISWRRWKYCYACKFISIIMNFTNAIGSVCKKMDCKRQQQNDFLKNFLENYTVIIYSLLFWHWRRNKFSLNFGNFHCFEARHCLWYYYEICWFDIYYFKFNAFKGSYIVNASSYPFILINKKLLFSLTSYFLSLFFIIFQCGISDGQHFDCQVLHAYSHIL